MTDARLYQGGVYSLGNGVATGARIHQSGSYMIGIYPSAQTRINQAGINILKEAETSSGLYLVKGHQLGAYALVRGIVDKPILHAWTFTQDDHDFYVLQLGSNGTLIYDKLTQQWCDWISPDAVNWRGNDGRNWEGLAVCCDTQSGRLWKIDADNRLDYEITPIESKIVGGVSVRFRKNVPCYMAELAISELGPAEGIDPSTRSISLRIGNTLTWTSHGNGVVSSDKYTVRWYGLGLMSSPGTVFEITDTGLARRIDGLNIEVGGNGDNQA